MGNAQTSHLVESEEDRESAESTETDEHAFCHQHKDAPISWSVKIGGKWTPYDRDTAEQLEMVYASDASFVRLTKGKYFGKPSRSGLYAIKINRNTSPPKLTQINTATKVKYEVSRLCGEVSSECDDDILDDGSSNLRSCQRSIGKTKKRHRENASDTVNPQESTQSVQSMPPRKRRRIENNQKATGLNDNESTQSIQSSQSTKSTGNKKEQCQFTYRSKHNQMFIKAMNANNGNNGNNAIFVNGVQIEGDGTSMELLNGDIIQFGALEPGKECCKMMVIKNESKRDSKRESKRDSDRESKEKGKRERKKKKQPEIPHFPVHNVQAQPTTVVVVDNPVKPPALESDAENANFGVNLDTTTNTTDNSNKPSKPNWACTKCTFSNKDEDMKCSMCYNPRES